MKFTFSWLKDHLDTDADCNTICEHLTSIGLEVEQVIDDGKKYASFVTAKIIDAKRHPNADRLSLCQVDIGAGQPVQVVCGAPNVKKAMIGVFAPPGTQIPNSGLVLKAGVIRGEESNGMLCSESELELSQEHDGIIELAGDTPIGKPYAQWAGIDEQVIEIAITPNRGDCLGVRGIARDLAATGIGTLKPLEYQEIKGSFASGFKWDIASAAIDKCTIVTGRHLKVQTNGASPFWMQKRLKSIGLRPISALVDVTNYIVYDLGRPLHVYDGDMIKSNCLRMDIADGGEHVEALDGNIYEMPKGSVIIKDGVQGANVEGTKEQRANNILGIGAIMGGKASGCTDTTRNVFLEAAHFDAMDVAKTGRKLGILSDARFRFERGVDPQSCIEGNHYATKMILDICAGEASQMVMAGKVLLQNKPITLAFKKIKAFAGIDISWQEAAQILKKLDFDVHEANAENIIATAASFRNDITHDVCLIEEIVRIYGYSKVQAVSVVNNNPLPKPAMDGQKQRLDLLRRSLASQGLMECVTWSFCSLEEAKAFGGGQEDLHLANPISQELSLMRPNLLINLLGAMRRNQTRKLDNDGLFELGPVFQKGEPFGQQSQSAGVRWIRGANSWVARDVVDVFSMKGDLLSVLEGLDVPVGKLNYKEQGPSWYHPGRSTSLCIGKTAIAHVGQIHPKICTLFDIKDPIAGFEILFDALPKPRIGKQTARKMLKLESLQAITRDFSFWIDASLPAEKLVRAVLGADTNLIKDVVVFDVFESTKDVRKSIALRVTLQPIEKSFSEQDLVTISQKIIERAQNMLNAELRN